MHFFHVYLSWIWVPCWIIFSRIVPNPGNHFTIYCWPSQNHVAMHPIVLSKMKVPSKAIYHDLGMTKNWLFVLWIIDNRPTTNLGSPLISLDFCVYAMQLNGGEKERNGGKIKFCDVELLLGCVVAELRWESGI